MRASPASAPWSWRLLRRAAAVATVCLSVGGALGYAVSRERGAGRPSATTRKPASPAELALVAPLRVGDALEDYSVAGIEAVHEGTMGVVLARGGDVVRLEIALADPAAPPPPATAGRYALYFDVHGAPSADAQKLAAALARIVTANAAAPPPPGLAPFAAHASP